MNHIRNTHDTGVAIVGLAARFPGARNIKEFWNNLAAGVESIHFSSTEELLSAGIDPKLAQQPGYIPASSTVEQPEFFDASFFGFSAREAEIIDPQQRVFLECAWEALEDAGCDPSTYPGSIGVFAGAGMNTYALLNLFSNPKIIESVGSYQAMIGNDKDFLSSRVAYKLNLRGPAIGVQTACSTSLVAVQMAFESLLRGECDVALAGGVSIPLPQSPGYTYVPGMILSRDGHCRAFDAEASGTVPGAGAGIVVLKRLDDALAENDQIYAVIRGAAVNNDGSAKVGYTAPSVVGQSAAVRRSMEMAGFSPESVGYVEAHGTGTEVGDPIEVTALTQVFSSASQRPNSCVIGALKTNLGHLDTAAGVAGLIKAALAVRNRLVPPTLHFTRPNPLIDFSKTPFYVSSSPVAYAGPKPFRAGVSSFGIGGTNAHVSLEEAPAFESDPAAGPQLIVLSAKSSSALDHMSDRLAEFLDSEPGTNLADLAFTLQKGRQAFQHRRILVVDGTDRLATALRRPEQTGPQPLKTGDAPSTAPRIVFLFPGQGSQYVNMGRDLYRAFPVYRDAVDRCVDLLQPHLAVDLRKLLHPQPADQANAERLLARTEYTQPALFVVEYAVAKLWMDCGISPSAMLGHSVGEYVAACLAGVFSLEDATALIAARGKMIQATPAGAMLAVGLPELDLEPLLTPKISVAAENSPGQTVASGEESAIAELESRLRSRKIECRRLRTSHAFHSPMMDAVVGEFTDRVAQVRLHAPRLPYLSNVTGTWITDAQATDPRYWASHLRGTVRFMDCGRRLLEEPKDVLLEAGPGDTLLSLLRTQLPPRSTRPMISSMRRAAAGEDDREHWLTAAGRLWLLSAPIDWNGLHRAERRIRVSLPTYPFERQRYWIEPKPFAGAPESAPAVPRKEPDIADWFYVPSWTRSASELLPASTVRDTDTWLVFATDDPASHPIVEGLRARGSIVTVNPGAAFRQLSSTQYELHPAHREDYTRLLQHLQGSGQWPDRIVHAWSFNSNRDASRDRMLDLTVFSAMFLVQAVEECSATRPVELNIVSERAYSVIGEQIFTTAGAALNAFCGVAALECPNITCRTIDVDFQADSARAACQLVEELCSPGVNEIVAYRGTARWVQQYTPVRVEAISGVESASQRGNSIPLRTGGTYLITGGLGGIGLVLARHLASNTGATIVLTSRTPLPERSAWPSLLESTATADSVRRRIEGVLSIEAAGGRVLSVPADTVDTAAMRRALATIRGDIGPVHGIIHAAGIAGAGMIQAKNREQANAVIAPKVQGVEWIRETLGSADLDFVMLCSSISAVLPSYGLADYAAANAYLDSFANIFDDPSGTRVLSVGWDTWGEVGMAVDIQLPGALALRREEGLKHAITSAEAEEVFDRVLNAPVPQILISTRKVDDLKRLTAEAAAQIKAGSSLRASTATVAHSRPESLEHFAAAGDDVEQFIVNVWQELLGVEPIGINDDFFSLGGHSLLGTQVLARMRDRFHVELTLRTIFEASTPAQLAQHVRTLSWASGAAIADEPAEREEIEI